MGTPRQLSHSHTPIVDHSLDVNPTSLLCVCYYPFHVQIVHHASTHSPERACRAIWPRALPHQLDDPRLAIVGWSDSSSTRALSRAMGRRPVGGARGVLGLVGGGEQTHPRRGDKEGELGSTQVAGSKGYCEGEPSGRQTLSVAGFLRRVSQASQASPAESERSDRTDGSRRLKQS